MHLLFGPGGFHRASLFVRSIFVPLAQSLLGSVIIQDEYTKTMKDTHPSFAQHLVTKTWFTMILTPETVVESCVQVGLSLLVLPWKVTISGAVELEMFQQQISGS